MGQVIPLKKAPVNTDLLEAYRLVISDGYNAGETFNRGSVQVMIGFISAAVVSLRVTGDEHWAKRFEEAGHALEQNWMSYPVIIPNLCLQIDSR